MRAKRSPRSRGEPFSEREALDNYVAYRSAEDTEHGPQSEYRAACTAVLSLPGGDDIDADCGEDEDATLASLLLAGDAKLELLAAARERCSESSDYQAISAAILDCPQDRLSVVIKKYPFLRR